MGTEWDAPKYQVVDSFTVTSHSSFLLCSDGFWELIDEKMMCKTLKKAKTPTEWLFNMRKLFLKMEKGQIWIIILQLQFLYGKEV